MREGRQGAVAPGRSDGGIVLLLTLLVTMVLSAVGTAVLLVTDFDVLAAANVRDQLDTNASAEAAVEMGIARLAAESDWSAIPGGAGVPFFSGALTRPASAGGQPVDAVALTIEAQRVVYGAGAAWGGDTPRLLLAGYGVPAADLPGGALSDRVYVLLWLSDDIAEADGNALADSNGILVLRAQALGSRGTRAFVQAVVGQTAVAGVVRRIGWRNGQ